MEEDDLPKPPNEHHCCECSKKVENALCEECEINLHLPKKKCVNFDCCTHFVDDENAILCTMCTKKQPQIIKHFTNAGSGSTSIQPDTNMSGTRCRYNQPTTSIVAIDDSNGHVSKCVRCNRTVYAVVCNGCHVKRLRSAESPANAVNAVDCKRKEPVENEDLSLQSISPLFRRGLQSLRPVPRRDKESNTSDCLNCQAPNAPLRDEIGVHLCSFCLKAQE